jgi:hypothetical protein
MNAKDPELLTPSEVELHKKDLKDSMQLMREILEADAKKKGSKK